MSKNPSYPRFYPKRREDKKNVVGYLNKKNIYLHNRTYWNYAPGLNSRGMVLHKTPGAWVLGLFHLDRHPTAYEEV